MLFLSQTSPLSQIHSALFPQIQLWVKRDDLLHPDVSGNKFRKLKYPLRLAKEHNMQVISMGGAWSNHLHALAHAGNLLGLRTTGLVRGLHNHHATTATLTDCVNLGMQLKFVSRETYRELRDDANAWQTHISGMREQTLWLPEGGSTVAAMRGLAELVDELPFIPDLIVVACGTATSLAGIVAGLRGRSQVIGIAAVSNAQYLEQQVHRLLFETGCPPYKNFVIRHEFHGGGFAKVTPELSAFCAQFEAETALEIEPVYTGKMFYALHAMAHSGELNHTTRVVAIHTGGLQGKRGYLMS
jgi:1-aminocyclopropane-1-carboxylate deaminase